MGSSGRCCHNDDVHCDTPWASVWLGFISISAFCTALLVFGAHAGKAFQTTSATLFKNSEQILFFLSDRKVFFAEKAQFF